MKAQPGVYMLKYGETIIYIGSSCNLKRRSRKRDRNEPGRFSAIMMATSVETIICKSVLKARQLEEQLIRKHRPQFNIRTPAAPADLKRTAQIIRDNW